MAVPQLLAERVNLVDRFATSDPGVGIVTLMRRAVAPVIEPLGSVVNGIVDYAALVTWTE